jgi:nucleoid-associated protein YgaU
LLLAACLVAAATFAAESPLSKDDVTLLLLGGATQEKIITLIQQRGVDFQMNPDLAQKFHDSGASDEVIEALQKAGEKLKAAAPAPGPQPPAAAAASVPAPTAPAASPPSATPAPRAAASQPPSKPAAEPGANLGDPGPDQVQKIIQEFAAKEELFKEARNNYTYHQINKVQTLDADGNVDGQYQQDWDILYDDNGSRIERVTYAPPDTLKRIMMTAEDLNAFRSIQPFVLTTEDLPQYDIKYMGHVKVDEITAYVFSIRPKEIKKGHQYFQGQVWVDDRDLQIVKSEGKNVPELQTKHGENLFPRFVTYREQIDGKFWFPTYTEANDTLHFSLGPVRIREIVKYTNYKQFKSTTKIKVLSEVPPDQNKTSAQSAPKK